MCFPNFYGSARLIRMPSNSIPRSMFHIAARTFGFAKAIFASLRKLLDPQNGAHLKLQSDRPTTSRLEATRRVRKPFRTIFASLLGLTVCLLILLVGAGTARQTRGAKEQYVRLSKPKLLTFDELVHLEKTDEPSAQLAVAGISRTGHLRSPSH